MEKWLLLILSVVCAGVAIEAFRWHGQMTHTPFSAISHLWRGKLSHLSLVEQQQLRDRYASKFGISYIPWLMATIAAALLIATVRAFLE